MARGNLAPVLRRLCATAVRPGTTDDGSMLERFAADREEAAFQSLVERHGPLVLGVCRRVLGDEHDAEDAFQATFLVLARRAGSIRKQSSVASWLYGVALRVASKARVHAARRRTGQLPSEDVPAAPNMDLAVRELRAVLDEELNRLAEKYRAPLVLCYLEGKTKDEAAAELGWPTGTVSGRLARARDLLRDRLTQRGLALSTALFVTLLSESAAPAALPVVLAGAATAAALSLAAGKPLAGIVSTPVAHLVEGVLRDMFLTKLKLVTVVLATFLLIGGGAGTWMLGSTEAAPIGENNPPAKAQTAPKATIARSRTFDSSQHFLVRQLIDGWPEKHLGTTPTPDRRGMTIPAGATWVVAPMGSQPNGGGIMWGGGRAGGGGGGGGGWWMQGGGFGGGGGWMQGGFLPQAGNGAAQAPANQGQAQGTKPPRLTDKELQALAAEIKRRSIAGLAMCSREFTDDDLARLKGLPSLQTLVLRNTTLTQRSLRTLKDFPSLRYLVLEGDILKSADVTCLADCKGLRTLELRGNHVTDELVANLKDVRGLKTLRLKYTALTEAGLKTVADMQTLNSQDGLENLELAGEAITDAGIAHLKAFGGLKALRLHLTEITDAGLAHLKNMPSLRLLDIDCGEDAFAGPFLPRPLNAGPGQKAEVTNEDGQKFVTPTGNLTDAGLKHLKDMKGLTELALCSWQFTDAGLEELSGLTALKRLRLAGPALSEKGLAALKPLKELAGLELFDGTFSPAGVATLKQLPKLRFLYLPVITTPKETGTKYVRGLAPKTKTWYGRPWLAMPSPPMMGGGNGVPGGGIGGFPGPVPAPGLGGNR